SRALALAEGKSGDYDAAADRLDAVIDAKRELGVTGLGIGTMYEARARIAIWAGDDAGLEKYAALTAKEYRHGRGSALGARWERLMAEARRASNRGLPRATEIDSMRMRSEYRTSVVRLVSQTLATASTPAERAHRALKLLCDDRGARVGHLYLVGER